MRISAVIVNYNAGSYLARAVASLSAQADAPLGEILVIDNGSSDGSLTEAAALDEPRLRIIELSENLGFARGCNVGVQAATGEILLFLNPDAELQSGALAALMTALAARPDAAMAGPLLLNPDGSEQRGGRREIPSPWQIFCYILRLPRLMPNHPRFRNFNHHGQPLPDVPMPTQAISGSCMLLRRSTIDRIGLMDPGYFMHFEDLEWCLRAQRASMTVLFVPSARVIHHRGVSSRRAPLMVAWHKHRSLVRFLRRNFTGYYPSSFMAILRFMVSLRFLWLAAKIVTRRAKGEDFMPFV